MVFIKIWLASISREICRVGYENARRQPLAISTFKTATYIYQKRTLLVRTKLCKCFFVQHFHLCRFNPFNSLFPFSQATATAAVGYNVWNHRASNWMKWKWFARAVWVNECSYSLSSFKLFVVAFHFCFALAKYAKQRQNISLLKASIVCVTFTQSHTFSKFYSFGCDTLRLIT